MSIHRSEKADSVGNYRCHKGPGIRVPCCQIFDTRVRTGRNEIDVVMTTGLTVSSPCIVRLPGNAECRNGRYGNQEVEFFNGNHLLKRKIRISLGFERN